MSDTARAARVAHWRFRVLLSLMRTVIGIRDASLRSIAVDRVPPLCRYREERIVIFSGTRRLDARLCLPKSTPTASLLILHGIGERVDYWREAQQFLSAHNVASLVYAYSGYGRSTGASTPANLREDVIAAYSELKGLVPSARSPFVLGLSLGTGIAVDAAPYLAPDPSGIVLCQPFSTFREAGVAVAGRAGIPPFIANRLARLLPDIYRTEETVQRVKPALLIVHSESDKLFPVWMARHISIAAQLGNSASAELIVPSGFAHNDAYMRPSIGYWPPILNFMAPQGSSPP